MEHNITYIHIIDIMLILLIVLSLTPPSKPTNCTVPPVILCPPRQYCLNASTIIVQPGTVFQTCQTALQLNASTVLIQGGKFNGSVVVFAATVEINDINCNANFTVYYEDDVYIGGRVAVASNFVMLVADANITNSTITVFPNTTITTRKFIAQAQNVYFKFVQVTTSPNLCLYKTIKMVELMRIKNMGIQPLLAQILQTPINIILYCSFLQLQQTLIRTTIIGIFSQQSHYFASYINTTASSCLTNLGMGKGLQAQMPNKQYCSCGGSSAGYGTLSNFTCAAVLQYFMFLAHAFPYISKGPFLSTGSGGYGYMEGLGNQGAGGGIIFIYNLYEMKIYDSFFMANGGSIGEKTFVSAGSGGSLFIYTNQFTGNNSNFSAAGGSSFNNNGSGAGGVVKISFNTSNFSQGSMWVQVNAGYQPNAKASSSHLFTNNGIFYGKFCPPGKYPLYLNCQPCTNNTFSLLGDSSCQQCPNIKSYNLNQQPNPNGTSVITECFSYKALNFLQVWIEPAEISWFLIVIYVVSLIAFVAIGLLVKKYYKKKLSVMQTQSFSLQDAKKDVQQTRILTQRLKHQRNIKFEDLMYHIHRITLFGSNNPQCPWALPEFPPQQIKKYILRQGFIDFSVKFNKIAKWTTLQKLINNISLLVYPYHWYYYDKIKKLKYKKLLNLLEQSKQFNLINNYDFEDKNMVTIKISKNTDYTICYLDFMVYDRADTKYFNLNSPFIISISGQGNFLRPFYLEDRDVFFNSLFYIINKAKQNKQKIEQQQLYHDEKRELFVNLFSQKKKQENRNKLIDFLKKFNTISITLDLSAPLSTFMATLISIIEYLAQWNQNYFKQLNIQLDLILMISKVRKGHVVSNQIHILTNKNPELFRQFMEENIPKMNRYQKYDLKLGLFVYNPDQEVVEIKNRRTTGSHIKKKKEMVEGIGSDQDKMEDLLVEVEIQDKDEKNDQKKKKKFKFMQSVVRFFNLVRYFVMTHRKLTFDKDLMKFFVFVVILFQCLLACVWSAKFQFPYLFANLLSPFIGILWMVSGSYGIGKLFLIFNSMALLDEIVTFILACSYQQPKVIIVCQIVTIIFRLLAIPLATKYLSVCRKLSTSKMFK